jgi:DNA repair protein SbcD/Mre11
LHRHQNLNPSGRCPVVYAGSPERVDFGERNEPKGYCDVAIAVSDSGEKTTSYTFVELPARPMIQIDVVIDPSIPATGQVLAALEKQSLKNAIVKVVYQVPVGQRDMVDGARVQRACQEAHYVAGIVPVHMIAKRTQRAAVTTQMSHEKLLQSYFESKQIGAPEQERLLSLARDLEAEEEKAREKTGGDEALHDE